MHILSINFISFAAQIYYALHIQGKKDDFWHLVDMAFLPLPLNPRMALIHGLDVFCLHKSATSLSAIFSVKYLIPQIYYITWHSLLN